MPSCRRILLACLIVSGLTACRKDRLHWQTATRLEAHGTHRLNNIRFVNDSLAIVVGGERFDLAEILISRDGGYTWQLQSHPEAGKELFGLTVAPNGSIYTVGFDGKLLWSADGGYNWTFRQLDFNPDKAIVFPTANKAVIIGGISFETGFIQITDSLGVNLSREELDYEPNDIVLLPDGTGFRCGYGVMSRTTDNGTTWEAQDLKNDNFTALDVHNPRLVWTCGYKGSIYKTTDGGAHWTCQRDGNNINLPNYRFQDILFLDELHGYAVGENGLVVYSDDGGDHWMELDRFTTEHLRCITRCPNGDLLVCGDNGTLYRLLPQ